MEDTRRVHQTLRNLLSRRGYVVPDPLPHVHFVVSRVDDADGSLLVFYAGKDARVGVGVVRDMVKLMDDTHTQDALFLAVGLTPSASAAINAARTTTPKHVVTISPAALLYDIFDHKSVPPHRILGAAERGAMLASYKLRPEQLPSMKLEDAMCRYLGGRPGDVFEITRNRPNVGHHLYYRHVVDIGE